MALFVRINRRDWYIVEWFSVSLATMGASQTKLNRQHTRWKSPNLCKSRSKVIQPTLQGRIRYQSSLLYVGARPSLHVGRSWRPQRATNRSEFDPRWLIVAWLRPKWNLKLDTAFDSVFSSRGAHDMLLLCFGQHFATWWTHSVESCRVGTLISNIRWCQGLPYSIRSDLRWKFQVVCALGLRVVTKPCQNHFSDFDGGLKR